MSPEQITAAAVRNTQARLQQINRLKPMVGASRTRGNELREAKDGAKEIKAGIELMSTLKHVPNFFPTPRKIIAQMIELADLRPGLHCLEPSAGKADIALALRAFGCTVTCCERNYTLVGIIRKHGFNCIDGDFLVTGVSPVYDRVLMNPPFERGIDEDHILQAFKFLKLGGRLVAVACSTTGNKLIDWADRVYPLPPGSFANSERSTQVNTCLVVKDKP